MNSPLPNTEAFNVLIWIKLPLLREQELSQWFNWLSDVIREKKLVSANVKIVPVLSEDIIDSHTIGSQIDALWTSIHKVSTHHKTLNIFKGDIFSEANCLRGDKSDHKQCFNIYRDPNYCGKKNLLLFLSENGVGYPCYGCWSFHKQDPSLCNEYRNNQGPFKVALISENYCGKCPQCINWSLSDKVPCLGGQTTVRSSQLETVGCPNFEISTQELIYHGRRFLQDILWRDDFKYGKKIILDPEIGIETYWSDNERIGNCQFQLDTAVNDSMPLFYQSMPAPQGTVKEMEGSGLLPWAFVPATSSLFFDQFETDRIMLMSIIFVKRPKEEDADFHYRSLYKDAEVNNGFQLLWRWPEERISVAGAKWTDHVLNFSAEFLDRKMGRNKRIPYVLSFSSVNEPRLRTRSLSESRIIRIYKIKEHLSPLYEIAQKISNYANECQVIIDADKSIILKNMASMMLATNDPFIERFYEAFRLYNEEFIDFFYCLFGDSGGQSVISDNKIKSWLDVNENGREAVRKLANYFIWLFSLFPNADQRLGSLEGFHMTFPPDSKKAPGGIVIYSSAVLRSSTSALVQIMLDALLSPIEQVYLNQEKEEGEKDKNEAQLIPKWAHGQRGTLFAVLSCLSEALLSTSLPDKTVAMIKTSDGIARAEHFIDSAYANVNLLQETGTYSRSLYNLHPRWKQEMERFLKSAGKISLFNVASEGMRTAFIRLFGSVIRAEADQRYLSAFQKFTLPRLLQEKVPDETDKRKLQINEPGEIAKRAYEKGFDLKAILSKLQSKDIIFSQDWWKDIFRMTSVQIEPASYNTLSTEYVPVDGFRTKMYPRPSAIVAAIRLTVEESMLNFIKHAFLLPSLDEISLSIIADDSDWATNRVKLLFVNRMSLEGINSKSNSDEGTAGSIGIGLMLCDYILKSIGGGAKSYKGSDSQLLPKYCSTDIKQLVAKWEHWYAIELDVPGRRILSEE